MKKSKSETLIEIIEMRFGRVVANIYFTTPMIMHRYSQKAIQQLLLPPAPMNAADKASNLKHDPVGEFRGCIYVNRDEKAPTLIHVPTGAFGRAIADVAVDMPGAKKAQVQRLTSITSVDVWLYGVPRLFMRMVRNSDIGRTPDMRTRAIFTEAACSIEIKFASTLIKEGQVINLLAAAGMIVGIGDWRPQRGGSYGQFEIVRSDDARLKAIKKHQARDAQLKAMANPVAFDPESEEILAWFNAETKRREIVLPSGAPFKPIEIFGVKQDEFIGKKRAA